MAEQALYVPHSLGTVIGSRQHRPWLARDAEQASTTPWRGQPAFVTAPDAYAWLDWVRQRDGWPAGLSVAHTDVHTELTAEGVHRVHIGPNQLRDAATQVLRPDPTTAGPDERVLAACHGLARADAMRVWLLETVGATARDRRHAALSAVWAYGYQLAARDGRAALAGHLARSVRATLADPQPNATREDGRAELARLDQVAATLAAGAALVTVPDLPPAVFDPASTAEREGGWYLDGWDNAISLVWKHALRDGAVHGVIGAAREVEALWRADPASRPHTTLIQARPAKRWLADTLNHAASAVANQWMLITARPLPAPPPQPDAAASPPTQPDPAEPTTAATGTPPAPPAGRAFTHPPAAAEQPAPLVPPPSPRQSPGRRR